MRPRCDLITAIVLLIAFAGCGKKLITDKAPIEHVKAQLKKLAPVELTADLSQLPAEEVEVVKLLVKAAQKMDDLFLKQVYSDNPDLLRELTKSRLREDAFNLEFFKIMFGPWDRMDEDATFINTLDKPLGANFYPADLTQEEFDNWIDSHPDDRKAFESEFTVIRREGANLIAIPYPDFFENEVKSVADLLKQAAEKTSDESLKKFLNSRAEAFLSNDYYQSDMDWMDLEGDIEVVIGPYEVYEDGLFGYKAAYEAFVCIVDQEESQKLEKISKYLNAMEDALPIPDRHKNFDRGASSPIKVVNEVFTGGDTKAGIQTSAFNLPNDERVREAKGSKKVMLKNVMRAKFDKCWIPIVNTVLAEKDLNRVSFDAYFNHVLMHEMAHTLGPGNITVNGRETTVNKELKELYSTIEECKADVLGMLTAQFLIDKGVFPKALQNTLYASNLGGMFRSIRFGIDSAHGGGVAIQINYYLDKGAVKVNSDGRFTVDDRKLRATVRDLARDLLMIQAEGDYAGAKKMIDTYKKIRPEVQVALDRLADVPVDIRPVYPIVNTLD